LLIFVEPPGADPHAVGVWGDCPGNGHPYPILSCLCYWMSHLELKTAIAIFTTGESNYTK